MNVSSSIEGYGLNLIGRGMKNKSSMQLMQDDLTYRFMPLQRGEAYYGLRLINPTVEIKEQIFVEVDAKVSSGNLSAYGLNLVAPTPYILTISRHYANKITSIESAQGYGLYLITPGYQNKREQGNTEFIPHYFPSYGLNLIGRINSHKTHILNRLEAVIKTETLSHVINEQKIEYNKQIVSSENHIKQFNKGSYTHILNERMTSNLKNLDGYGLMLI